MIYFAQRQNDEGITIGLTDDLQKTLFQLQSKGQRLQLLGVIPGGEKEYTELANKFSPYKLETEDLWYLPASELLDFIDENATLSDSGIKASAQFKISDYTPIKQQALSDALDQQMNLVVHITEKWNRVKPYLYFDLHAGPGLTENDQPGSPLVFRNVADKYRQNWPRFHYQASLYEMDVATYTRLIRALGNDPRFTIENTTHEILVDELRAKLALPPKERNWVFGAVYADPSNAVLPWELLRLMNQVYPRVDVMINIACASYKRTISVAGYQTLADRLPTIKEHWIVRRPFGKHQWSILIGTNWPDYPAWEKRRFYRWNDGGIGTSIFEKLVYTPEQLQARDQLKLWDDEDE